MPCISGGLIGFSSEIVVYIYTQHRLILYLTEASSSYLMLFIALDPLRHVMMLSCLVLSFSRLGYFLRMQGITRSVNKIPYHPHAG